MDRLTTRPCCQGTADLLFLSLQNSIFNFFTNHYSLWSLLTDTSYSASLQVIATDLYVVQEKTLYIVDVFFLTKTSKYGPREITTSWFSSFPFLLCHRFSSLPIFVSPFFCPGCFSLYIFSRKPHKSLIFFLKDDPV